MKKLYILFLLILTGTFINLQAQTPQFYNSALDGTPNSFPFNTAGGKMVQGIIPPGTLINPTPATAGNITKYYVRIASTGALGPATYTDFVILFAQSTMTVFSGAFYSGAMDTVYKRASVTLSAAGGTWLEFVLDHPFSFDPTKSLIVQIGQCAVSGTYTGYSLAQTVVNGFPRRTFSSAGCPYTYGGASDREINCGIDVAPAVNYTPDILYYKFENNPTTTSTPNCASPGVGTNVSPLTNTTLTPGGQFDSCLTGAGVSNGGVSTGWNCNLGTSSWTISMWLEASTTTFGYIFGDGGSGSFRCFNNGAAGTNAITLRGTGIANVDVTGFATGPVAVCFVYDSAAANIKVYKDGVLFSTVPQTPLNLATGTGFKVGGYTTSAVFTGKMDEFRLYRRALSAADVLATYNQDIACGIVSSIGGNENKTPASYMLNQNYPNPFNPVTKISFSLPKSGLVTLKVFDVLGKEVAILVNETKKSGNYIVDFNATNLSTGIYFYRIDVNGFTDVKKMILIK